MKEIISIIIPIYNSQKYLQELLESILSQTYDCYELLLINDGSKDDSEKICLEYAKKDKRISYYKKKNTGVSDTRNYGISICKGKYICFIDSDDILDKNYLNDFIYAIHKTNSELVCCNYEKFVDKSCIVNNKEPLDMVKIYDNSNKFDLLYDKYSGYLWNKMFVRELIIDNNIKFNDNIFMCEDMLFVFEYLKYVNSVGCINAKNYKYRIINESASKRLNNIKWFSIFITTDEFIKNRNLYSSKTFNDIMYSYIYHLYEAKYRLKKIKKSEEYNVIKSDISNRIKELKKYNYNLSKKQKLKIFFYKNFNSLSFVIKKRKDKTA